MPDYFEVADCLVNLGGDALNSVPRYRVTAGEIAVLQVIHGNDAVTEIKPLGKIARPQRAERARLANRYGNAKDSQGNSLVEKLYPGAAARIFERIEELALVDSQFAAIRVGRGGSERQAVAMAEAEKGLHLAAVTASEIIPFEPGEEPKAGGGADYGTADNAAGEDLEDLTADDEPLTDPPAPAAESKSDDAFA